MDHNRDSGTPSSHTTFGGSVLEQQEQPLSSSRCQTESEGSILLHLLEFKSHLLEVVEELHIRRDAESRFEDQISKLVLEKQELDWEKESLQNQMEMEMKQHTEELTTVKKQFQAKLQSIEEEKGKYQVTAELKDKEINNLKEKLKSLQLLKYNLEKNSSELEQKLALKSRTKDTHVHQLGEVEKRFSALSRQCAVVKQAHEKLEQNADEAMRINRKLTSANQKQEATIASLKKELDEFRSKLIKVKMTSVSHDKSHGPTIREQHVQELRQKLHMETEMSKKLEEENATERAEKQELMRSLQHAQQLLLSQTQTVGRAEQELQVQREMFQALQHKHEVMREKGKAMEDKVAQRMEDHAASKTGWDKEKTMLLDQIKSKQEDLEAMKEAYEDLHQRHIELSLQAKPQAQHANEQEMEDVRGGKSVEPISSSERSGLSDLQHSEKSDHQHDTSAATREGGGESTANHSQQSQKTEYVLNGSNAFSGSLESANLSNHCDDSRLPSETNMLNQILISSELSAMSESGHSIGSGLIEVHDGFLCKVSCVSDTTAASDPHRGSLHGFASLKLIEGENKGNREMVESKQGRNNDAQQQNIRAQEEGTSEQQDRGDFQEHVEDGKNAGVETADRTNTREDILWLTKETGETVNHETETKDRADGEVTYGVKERGQKAEHTSETQIPAQTSTDITEESFTLRVSDCVDTELPLTVCEPSDFSQLLSQKFAEHAEIDKEVCLDKHQSVSQGTNFDIQDVQSQCPHDVQTLCEHAEPESHQSSPVGLIFQKATDEKTSKEAVDFSAESSEILKQLSMYASQMYDTSLTGQSVCSINVHEWETGQTQSEICNLSDITANVRLDAPQPLSQCKETAVEGREGLGSVVDGVEDGACKNEEGQSDVNTCEKITCETGQTTAAPSCFKEVTMEAAHLKPESRHCQSMKNDKPVTAKDKNRESSEAGNSECHEQEVGVMRLHDSSESSLSGRKTYSSLFEWRKALSSRANMDLSMPDRLTQGISTTTGPAKIQANQSSTISSFIQTKHNKAPLVITRASDLFKASSVSGAAASSRRQQRGEFEGKEEMCREAKAADTDRTTSPISSFSVSTISSTGSELSWQTPRYSRAPTSSAGPSLEVNWERSWSQENEGEQSSFRAQISKIEQFLNSDRLRQPKRRRTDN